MQYLLFIIAAQLAVPLSYSQTSYFSTDLQYGNFTVGFKTIFTNDLSRPAVAEQSDKERQGRFMQVNIWYPAKKNSAASMKFGDYINLLPQQAGQVNRKVASLAEKQFFNNTAELKGDTALLRKHFSALVNSKTKAINNAAVAAGEFPLIIFSDYPNNQSILCEYLASHGYVVVSAPLKGTYTTAFEYAVAGIESGIADLQFALSVARKEFKIKQAFTVMGLGIGATVALGLQMRNPDVAGMISLEGGITTNFEFNLIRQSPFFNNERIDKPMLVIHAPHPDVKPELTDAYKYADRWLINIPQSSEFYFLNYGIWETAMPGILGKAPGDTKTSFEAASNYILHFLQANYKQQKFSPLTIDQKIAITNFKEAVPVPPGINEIIAQVEKSGMSLVEKLYHERSAKDPEAIPFTTFYRVAEHFIAQKNFSTGAEWTALFAKAFPSSAVPWFMSGRCQLELNNKTVAKEFYEKALALLPGDNMLSENERNAYRPAIEKRIKELNG